MYSSRIVMLGNADLDGSNCFLQDLFVVNGIIADDGAGDEGFFP